MLNFLLKIVEFPLQALAGERACYNTVQNYGNQVLLLGFKSCHVVSIRSWIERLDSLVDKVSIDLALPPALEPSVV